MDDQAQDQSRLRIVIVDDEPDIRTALGRILRPFGEARLFGRAGDALVYLTANTVDLILTDTNMPEMLGTDFLARLVVSGLAQQSYRVIMSGDHSRAAIVAVRLGYAHEFLQKPISLDEFEACARRAMVHRVKAIACSVTSPLGRTNARAR